MVLDKKDIKDIIIFLELQLQMFEMAMTDKKATAIHRIAIKNQKKKLESLIIMLKEELSSL